MKEKWKDLYFLRPAHPSKKTENLNYSNLSSSQLIKNAQHENVPHSTSWYFSEIASILKMICYNTQTGTKKKAQPHLCLIFTPHTVNKPFKSKTFKKKYPVS